MEPGSHLEDLLAQALAAHDAGADRFVEFLAQHAEHRAALEPGLERCRQMGLLGHATADARDFPERLGPFRLLRRLGSGGMGTVYEALQDDLGRKVALKVIRPELLYVAGARERFRREIDAIGHLDHPAIVGIVAAGEHEGIPYFAMQLLAGATVAEATAALRGLPACDCASATDAVAGRLAPAGVALAEELGYGGQGDDLAHQGFDVGRARSA